MTSKIDRLSESLLSSKRKNDIELNKQANEINNHIGISMIKTINGIL